MSDIEAPKPKRKYVRKSKMVEPQPEPIPEPIPEPEPQPEPIPEPEPEPQPQQQQEIKVKKPRTDKQIAAFNKMREQRFKKTEEITELKKFEKEKKLMEKEQARLEKIKEKIARPLLKRSQNIEQEEEVYPSDNDRLDKVSTQPKYVFV